MEWTHFQRVLGDLDEEFEPLKAAIRRKFSPAVLGREILEYEHELFTLPAKKGGLAICDPVSTASTSYKVSKAATMVLQESIRTGEKVESAAHMQLCTEVLSVARKEKTDAQLELQSEVLARMPAAQHRTLSRIISGEASGWLTVLPLADEGYDLSATQFRDQLALRYHCPPPALPSACDGCGAPFSLQHGLNCAKGGLSKKGHDQVRNCEAQLAEEAWGGVVLEPVLVPELDRAGHPSLQADWSARGVWEGSRVAFFDNRIIDADAPSYVSSNTSWQALANRAAQQKRAKYQHVVEDLRGSITPLVCSTDGVLHVEYRAYQRRLAHRLALKREQPFSSTMAWVRIRLQFAIIRAVDLRLRGARMKFRGLSPADGLNEIFT